MTKPLSRFSRTCSLKSECLNPWFNSKEESQFSGCQGICCQDQLFWGHVEKGWKRISGLSSSVGFYSFVSQKSSSCELSYASVICFSGKFSCIPINLLKMYRSSSVCSASLHLFICNVLYIQSYPCCQPLWLIKVVCMNCSTPFTFPHYQQLYSGNREAVETAVQS